MNQFVTAADVRTFANLTGTTGRYADASISSNILTAQEFIQGEAHRLFAKQDGVTKTFTTGGRAGFAIPDLRTATTVTWDGATLTAGESYDLIPDAKQSGIYVAIQLRPVDRGGKWYYGNSRWFDNGYDLPRRNVGSDTNDLTILGDWGWDPLPYDVLHAVKAMAAWLIKRGDAVLAGAVADPAAGTVFDYTQLPTEVTGVIRKYRGGEQLGAD